MISGLGKKLTKLRKNPRLFIYDLVASRTRRDGAARWLLARWGDVLTDAVTTLAVEQSTIAPLAEQLSSRISRYGVVEVARAATKALERLDDERRELLFVAATLALAEHELGAGLAFGDAWAASAEPESIHSLVIAGRDSANYELALHFISYLPIDDKLTQLELGLYRLKLEEEYGEAMAVALHGGEPAVSALVDELLTHEDALPVYHFAYAHVIAEYSKERRLAGMVTQLGESLLELSPRSWTACQVSDAHLYQGNIREALRVLEPHVAAGDDLIAVRRARLESLEHLAEHGFDYQPKSSGLSHAGIPGKVLFTLHHSAPLHCNGYATRGHGLLCAINRRGWDVDAVTRLGYPHDLVRFADIEVPASERIDRVQYVRIFGPGQNKTPLYDYLARYADRLMKVVIAREPEILHAHSNAINGLVTNRVARALGIPSIYEVRGFWEVTRASRQPGFDASEYCKLLHEMEITAAREADAVICITEALADELVRGGVDRDKITVIPNAVDVERFTPRPRERELEAELGLSGKRVIGYVGSVVDYEGLDDLLSAIAILVEGGRDDVAVLIVGDGVVLERLRDQATSLGLDGIVTFTGRVPHTEVERYYSLIDIAPFPRKSLPVTEMVSPLKPFEAMAMNKVIIASDVAALAEIIEDGVNGFLFAKDDPKALAKALERGLEAIETGTSSVLSPRSWVTENRTWSQMAVRLETLYRRLSPYRTRPQIVDLADVELAGSVSAIRDEYDRRHVGSEIQQLRPDDYSRLSHVLEVLEPGGALLDVGVGPGQLLNIAARANLFEELRGVDVVRHPLLFFPGESIPIDFHSVESLPYLDGQFDVVTCLEVIEHLGDEAFDRGISELRRVCGGQLVVTVPFRERVLADGHQRRFDLDEINSLFPTATVTILRKTNSQLGRPTYWALIEERQATGS